MKQVPDMPYAGELDRWLNTGEDLSVLSLVLAIFGLGPMRLLVSLFAIFELLAFLDIGIRK